MFNVNTLYVILQFRVELRERDRERESLTISFMFKACYYDHDTFVLV